MQQQDAQPSRSWSHKHLRTVAVQLVAWLALLAVTFPSFHGEVHEFDQQEVEAAQGCHTATALGDGDMFLMQTQLMLLRPEAGSGDQYLGREEAGGGAYHLGREEERKEWQVLAPLGYTELQLRAFCARLPPPAGCEQEVLRQRPDLALSALQAHPQFRLAQLYSSPLADALKIAASSSGQLLPLSSEQVPGLPADGVGLFQMQSTVAAAPQTAASSSEKPAPPSFGSTPGLPAEARAELKLSQLQSSPPVDSPQSSPPVDTLPSPSFHSVPSLPAGAQSELGASQLQSPPPASSSGQRLPASFGPQAEGMGSGRVGDSSRALPAVREPAVGQRPGEEDGTGLAELPQTDAELDAAIAELSAEVWRDAAKGRGQAGLAGMQPAEQRAKPNDTIPALSQAGIASRSGESYSLQMQVAHSCLSRLRSFANATLVAKSATNSSWEVVAASLGPPGALIIFIVDVIWEPLAKLFGHIEVFNYAKAMSADLKLDDMTWNPLLTRIICFWLITGLVTGITTQVKLGWLYGLIIGGVFACLHALLYPTSIVQFTHGVYLLSITIFAQFYRRYLVYQYPPFRRQPTIAQNRFTFGIFDGFLGDPDWRICCASIFCMPVRWADTASVVGFNGESSGLGTYWMRMLGFGALVTFTLESYGVTMLFALIWAIWLRRRIRKVYLLPTTSASTCEDTAVWLFCAPCATMQEAMQAEFVNLQTLEPPPSAAAWAMPTRRGMPREMIKP